MHISSSRALVGALLAAAAAACSTLGDAVKVTRTPAAEGAEPRPKGCNLEFLWKSPARPYEALGELSMLVTKPPPGGAVEVLRDPACELGADAVIVSRDKGSKVEGHAMVAGTAIKYREAAPPSPQPEPQQPPGEPLPGSVDL